jgi:uncharacterized membrane protein YozB (DUF420 family)
LIATVGGNALDFSVETLPAINATLNALAGLLLVTGWLQIKTRRERAHKISMLTAFGVSSVFLACYLVYHYLLHRYYDSAGIPFKGPPAVRTAYLTILISHVVLAATVPFLAGATIYLGLRDRRQRHRQLARWTFPIWLYVSVTGVIIYGMLYHLYPESSQDLIISKSVSAAAEVDPTIRGNVP